MGKKALHFHHRVFSIQRQSQKYYDWNDLVKDDVPVITPNPKTSGSAHWNFLAAWAYAKHQPNTTDDIAKQFVSDLYRRVPVMDADTLLPSHLLNPNVNINLLT